jgi:S1-C subfamily serine protease
MFKKLLLSLSLSLLFLSSLAAEPKPEFTNAVARVVFPDGIGSGFFSQPNQVVTARHVADEIRARGSRGVYVYDSAGNRHRVLTITDSYDSDLSILGVDSPVKDAPVAEITCRRPEILETLLAVGHPVPYTNIFSPVMVVGYTDARDGDDAETLVVAGAIAAGMSGGPLFDKEGKVIGIVSSAYNASFTNIVLLEASELCTEPEPLATEETPQS